ncbi:CTP synthase [Seminavis robusta]|uniref:CTP synthase n=1 Tax=Seminavis robusta TaxID=568900 RepID=A0A9N8EP44_9STRA|nr:CTP synthase [Seminavis robusta]|eukprot:Sro1431_g272000.1 CTP synthase (599) ;mRNA; r:8527-10323
MSTATPDSDTKKKMKYIVVTGGVVSGLGKGITISSMGRLLQACGYSVTALKIDPYLNVDAGTMSPFEHGEVFVLEDGGESDLDLGNYERFLGISLTADHNLTTGKVYSRVIAAERRGDYLGKTVQVVPHITNAIQEWMERVAHIPVDPKHPGRVADICLIEVGGTVGDIESSVFLEALRQFQFKVGHDNFCLAFVSLVPYLGEQKTKPTQHGVKDLRSLGLSPSVIFCRSKQPLLEATRDKISNFCHVPPTHVLGVHNVQNVYLVPTLLQEQNLHAILQKQLNLGATSAPELGDWADMARSLEHFEETVVIALIGKYTGLQDSYLSVIKALKHASIAQRLNLELLWVEAAHLEENDSDNDNDKEQYNQAWDKVKRAQGIVVPGGFGDRGFLGKVLTAEYCRTHATPFLGICLGFQAMVVEYGRNICHWEDAHSTELDENTKHPVVMFMPEVDPTTMGGTMRLGGRDTIFMTRPDTITDTTQEEKKTAHLHYSPKHADFSSQLQGLYGSLPKISERHRHRYEVNPQYVPDLEDAGLVFCGRDETGERMEIVELPLDVHPYYVGTQFHPEFKSRPLHPSPPFVGLIQKAHVNKKTETTAE